MCLNKKICCFIGNRDVIDEKAVYLKTKSCIEELIKTENINTFYFGSRSMFDDLCLKIVTGLKCDYPDLVRVYVRAEYEYISSDYEAFLLQYYDKTFYAKKAHNANCIKYIKRNEEMIETSDICILYFNGKKCVSSGTYYAYNYAKKLKKRIKIIGTLNQE